MNSVSLVLSGVMRGIWKLTLWAAAAVFALSLLVFALGVVVFVLLKALITGRKPIFVTAFQHVRQAQQQFRWRDGGAGFGQTVDADVVDVQASEVRTDRGLPLGPSSDQR